MGDLRERIVRTLHAALLAKHELRKPYPFDDVPDDTPVMTSKSDYYRATDAILALPELAPLRAEERALILTALRDRENVADAKEFDAITRLAAKIGGGASDDRR